MWQVGGKVVLVTGASRGLGRALVETFAERGAHVAFCARTAEPLMELEAELLRRGVRAMAAPCDVGREADVLRLVRRTVRRFGRIDALINNASVLGPRVPMAEFPTASWKQVLSANLTGTFLMSREVVHVMLRQGGGSIVNVSSSLGIKVKPAWGAYVVSKWGLEGFSRMLAEELRGTGVRVNVVDPGAMRTAMRAAACPNEDPMTLPTPKEIVQVFEYLASDDARDVTGQRFIARDFARGQA